MNIINLQKPWRVLNNKVHIATINELRNAK